MEGFKWQGYADGFLMRVRLSGGGFLMEGFRWRVSKLLIDCFEWDADNNHFYCIKTSGVANKVTTKNVVNEVSENSVADIGP
ncbi:hypothetical protein Tco_0077118 [Tanacetum coccineum]